MGLSMLLVCAHCVRRVLGRGLGKQVVSLRVLCKQGLAKEFQVSRFQLRDCRESRIHMRGLRYKVPSMCVLGEQGLPEVS